MKHIKVVSDAVGEVLLTFYGVVEDSDICEYVKSLGSSEGNRRFLHSIMIACAPSIGSSISMTGPNKEIV